MRSKLIVFLLLVGMLYAGAAAMAMSEPTTISPLQRPQAQQCGIVEREDQLVYPINRSEFMLVNPYNRPNPRFDGRLHTGDDWILIEGDSLGEPVYAIAPGRVTYSNPTGWGRDKGVVIIEHVFSDGGVVYSLYGHLEESDTISFPRGGACVQTGDVVGVIGDPRPAPHLHFEIRNFDPSTPGPGYWPVSPFLEGWLNPRQFIDNRRAWLNPAYEWHIVAGNIDGVFPSPLLLADNRIVVIDGTMLRYISAIGQSLQQFRLADSVNAVGIMAFDEQELLATDDGRVLFFTMAGGLLDVWDTELESLTSGPYIVGDNIALLADEGTLYYYNRNRQLFAQVDTITPVQYVVQTANRIALYAAGDEVYVYDAGGILIERIRLRPNSDIISGPGDSFIVRDQTELFRFLPDGTRETITDELSVNRTDSQMVWDGDQIILWGIDGISRLKAIGLDGAERWETDVLNADPLLISRLQIQQVNACTTVLVSPRGKIMAFDSRNGRLLSQLKVWGEGRSSIWIASSAIDGQLRLQVADQIIAYNLSNLSRIDPLYCQ